VFIEFSFWRFGAWMTSPVTNPIFSIYLPVLDPV